MNVIMNHVTCKWRPFDSVEQAHSLHRLAWETNMLINSLFMINTTGDIFMEKHWRSAVNKSICDYFFEAQAKAFTPEDIPPVITTPHYYLVSVYRNKVYFVAVIQDEVPPLFVIEFLHRIMDIFADYFGEFSDQKIRDNFVVVYELLEEVLDNGFPLATETNVLKEMIKPPSLLGNVVRALKDETSVSASLPSGQLSNVPWRRTGVKYMHNEIFFDLMEEIDCLIDKQGSTISSEVKGMITCTCHLTGMPDLTLCFSNPRIMEDVSFHPCVRYKRWEAERIVSFVPPDGNFVLLNYHLGSSSMVPQPITVTPQFHFSAGGGKFDIRVGQKQSTAKGTEDLELLIPFSKDVTGVNSTTTLGFARYDPAERILKWKIGKLDPQKSYFLNGTLMLQGGSDTPESHPSIMVHFKIPSYAASGTKVTRLDIHAEKYKAFKGIKYITKAGKYQVRS